MPDPARNSRFHEVGHAAVATVLGWEVTGLMADDRTGKCWTRHRPVPPGSPPVARARGLFDELTVDVAGCVAEHLAGLPVGIVSEQLADGSSPDVRAARGRVRVLLALPPDAVQAAVENAAPAVDPGPRGPAVALVRAAEARAAQILDWVWPAVERAADALRRHPRGTLDGDQFAAAFRGPAADRQPGVG